MCHIRMESYGSALQDASKAIELDPSYAKVCASAQPGLVVICNCCATVRARRVIIGELLQTLLCFITKTLWKTSDNYLSSPRRTKTPR